MSEAAENTGDSPSQAPTGTPRAGRCAIIGRPNVGKSTLLNQLLGQKLAITTPRPGTTRANVLGVYSDSQTQIAFVDTPGINRPRSVLHKVLVDQAQEGLMGSDLVLMMTDVGRTTGKPEVTPGDEMVLQAVKQAGRPTVLAINKVDRLRDKKRLLPMLEFYQQQVPFVGMVPISATAGTNVDNLVSEIRQHLPEGLMYDAEFFTDRPERFFVAELIREAALGHTREEIPYGVAVEIDEYLEEPNLVRITASVIVEKPSHKGILIGAQGGQIKSIGTAARKGIEELLGRKVFLKLWVKVLADWTNNPRHAHRLTTEAGT